MAQLLESDLFEKGLSLCAEQTAVSCARRSRADSLSTLMRGIHGKYMAHRRDAKPVFVSQIQAIETIDELGAVGHGHLLRMTVEDVQGHSTEHRVPQSRELFQLVAWSYFAAGAIPAAQPMSELG